MWSLAILSVVWAGCQSSRPTSKPQLQHNWDQQRAALKCQLAAAELRSGRVDAALVLAREAALLSPQQPAHAELLAQTYIAKGDFAAAQDVLQTLRRSHPEFAGAAYLLGTIYERQRRWELAIEAYGQAAAASPEVLDYLVALAQAVAQSGNVAAAIEVIRDEQQRFASEPLYHLACAELNRQAGRLAEASAAYQQALQLGLDDPGTRQSLGLCLHWLGRHRAALDYLEPLVRAEEEPTPAVMGAYASCLLATGQAAQAADWLGRFTVQRPELASLWLLLAQARAAQNDFDKAADAAQRAASLVPRSPEPWAALAAIFLAAGKADAADEPVRRALELAPDNADVLLLHGRMCEWRGDCAGAAEAYRAAGAADPGNELAAELLAQIE